jgi:hypothetical protein
LPQAVLAEEGSNAMIDPVALAVLVIGIGIIELLALSI